MAIGSKAVEVQLKVPRVLCFVCGLVRQVKLGFADPKKHYTRAFERYVLELSRHMTIQDVAEHLQVSWDTVKDIQARSLHKRFGKPKLHKLKHIAIDEIAIGKGHHYLTVVLNLVSGAVVFVGDGKGVEAPRAGTGKTLLALVSIVPALGHRPPKTMTADCEESEIRKRITAVLRDSPTAVLFDNLGQGRRLGSSSLASVLTVSTWSDRILGSSLIASLPVTCAWMATGNNPVLSDEMSRRTVRCRLDAGVARPHMRKGFKHHNIPAWARAHRADLVRAVLTLAQAWVRAGRPKGDVHLGMYEAWADVVGGVLQVAGVAGLRAAIERDQGAATETEQAVMPFILAWQHSFGSAVVGAKDLYAMADKAESLDAVLNAQLPAQLPAQQGRAAGSIRSKKTRLGMALRRLAGQINEGLRIEAVGADNSGRQMYQLVGVGGDMAQ